MKQIRATVRIRGVVQGVSFRYYTRQEALRHQLTGWVRNLPNGEVEALFEGRESQIRQVLDWCRQGPPAAQVSEVDVDWEEFRGEFAGFDIRR
ncbi:acylphosphatase [Desulfuromonas versatilis]|uniref:Acylphosphatase n=1 Tax=Desulfuromonas versatilis TaxID=2802975 RepID=A0ABM8HSK3_9BACT|nr:acylphosphatase [Desulfuromonas versatilis]BCR03950.1 acylphosphatase [Desulfuromonas versatilis]